MTVRRALLLAICLFAAFTRRVEAQEPAPARLALARFDGGGEPIALTLAWRFHAGDDPRRSAPSFDDRAWETVDPRMPAGARPRGGWNGVGWFRRHVVVTDVPSRRIQLTVEAPGRASVFLDGTLVLESQGTLANPHPSSAIPPSGAWAVVDLPRGPHVFAVRYACDCASRPETIGFHLTLDGADGRVRRATIVRRESLILGVFIGIPAVLGALHLALFFYYRKARENLFCALCMLSLALIIGASIAQEFVEGTPAAPLVAALLYAGIGGATFFGLMTHASIRLNRIPRTWTGFAIAGALLPVAGMALNAQWANIAWTLYFAASLAEIVRVEMKEDTVERESAFPLLVGMLLLDAAIITQILIAFGVIPAPFGFDAVYLAGVLAFSLSTSLFVARSFARTSVHLERQLAEVQTLSAQMIATERESARRGLEIEAARTLQRSILPLSVPQLPGLELAAQVTTASEVGGDYYDFRVSDDRSVTIAIGDAAGHGVAAGAMVTATKALFSSMAADESLPGILAKCDRVLRDMNVRPLHMCLLLARVSPASISVSSAAMPRPLLFRASTGEVEEVVVGGLPLAAGFESEWVEESVRLAAGDVLLFASDGLAEALSPEGDPLGYDRAATLFAGAVPAGNAEAIIATLMSAADTWRGSSRQNDDIAMVIVRVTGPDAPSTDSYPVLRAATLASR